MTQQQHHAQIQQWAELEAEGRHELREKARMRGLEAEREGNLTRDLQSPEDADAAFREALIEKHPILKLWPGRTTK